MVFGDQTGQLSHCCSKTIMLLDDPTFVTVIYVAYWAGSPHISRQLLAQVVEMLVTVKSSPIQDYNHQDKCNRSQLVL